MEIFQDIENCSLQSKRKKFISEASPSSWIRNHVPDITKKVNDPARMFSPVDRRFELFIRRGAIESSKATSGISARRKASPVTGSGAAIAQFRAGSSDSAQLSRLRHCSATIVDDASIFPSFAAAAAATVHCFCTVTALTLANFPFQAFPLYIRIVFLFFLSSSFLNEI